MRTNPGQRKLGAVLRAVGLRVVVWGTLTAAVLAYFVDLGDLRLLVGPTANVARINNEAGRADLDQPGWPSLRGPDYNAHSGEIALADAWPPEGPPVLWAREIGHGYSALIAVGNRVYTQRQTLTDQSVLCLDADTGDTLWEHRYGWRWLFSRTRSPPSTSRRASCFGRNGTPEATMNMRPCRSTPSRC